MEIYHTIDNGREPFKVEINKKQKKQRRSEE